MTTDLPPRDRVTKERLPLLTGATRRLRKQLGEERERRPRL